MSAAERLISSDDHVDLAHPEIKLRLATKYHAAYDAALGEFGAAMAKSMSSEANGRWREQQNYQGEQHADMMSLGRRRFPRCGSDRSFGREGAPRGSRRGRRRCVGHVLRGQRVPLPLPAQGGQPRGDAGLQPDDARLRLDRSPPVHHVLPDPDPRHRGGRRRGEVGRGPGREITPAPRVPPRSSACPTTGTSATTRSGRSSRRPISRSACTSASIPSSRASPVATRRRRRASSSAPSPSRPPSPSACSFWAASSSASRS
jgi:hypothetical protein